MNKSGLNIPLSWTRRDWIKGAGMLSLAALIPSMQGCAHNRITGIVYGPNYKAGHKLRAHLASPIVSEVIKTNVLVAGAGVSGLSALRFLSKENIKGLHLIELEAHAGGNTHSGQNKISAYPWGAHYLPSPNPDAVELLEFLRESELIEITSNGILLNEEFLCHEPEERLFINGFWQEGLVPNIGVPGEDLKEFTRFFETMDIMRKRIGEDGQHWFAIPVDRSSREESALKLDQVKMIEWLELNHFSSLYLKWYLNYAYRDDYGTTLEEISAWAGIYYFAARRGQHLNAQEDDLLTWPEGNNYLTTKLCAQTKEVENHFGQLLFSINAAEHYALALDLASDKVIRYDFNQLILACPQFVRQRILSEGCNENDVPDYSPWMVANLTVQLPIERPGHPLSWDNVWMHSESLGFIHNRHQHIGQQGDRSVFTYFYPLTQQPAKDARKLAMDKSWEEWKEDVLADFKRVYPNIENYVEHLDVWLWGHAMVKPLPGYIWGGARQRLQTSVGDVHFAHSDLGGVSLFEEAFYQGLRAAQKCLANLS